VFYQRQDGSLIPAWNTIIETPPDERSFEPRFTAVMRQITSEDDYITFSPSDSGFRVYAATQRSADLLGVTHDAIGDGRASMLAYFPTIARSFRKATVELDREQVRQLRDQPDVHDMRRQFGLRRHKGTKPVSRHRKSHTKRAGVLSSARSRRESDTDVLGESADDDSDGEGNLGAGVKHVDVSDHSDLDGSKHAEAPGLLSAKRDNSNNRSMLNLGDW